MEQVLEAVPGIADQDRRIAEIFEREQARLRNFIRRRVANAVEAEDILQDIFYELVEAYRLMKPVEHAGAWLYRVARNRIIDLFRKKRPRALGDELEEGWENLLPSPDGGPDAAYARSVLMEELDAALSELPPEQREIFVAHELEGRSFQEMALETGVNQNTLISRKRYAVLHLRRRLHDIFDDFTGS